MSRLYNTFEFVGNISIPKSKEKFHEVKESTSGWVGNRLRFAIQESKTNSAFLEMYGGYSKGKANKVFSFSKGTENQNGSKLEIPWDDRLNEETIDMVADFKKIVVDYTKDAEVKEKINQLRYEIRTIEYKDNPTDEEQKKWTELKIQLKEAAKDRKEFIHDYDAITYLSETLELHKDYKFKVTGSIDYQEHNGKFYRKFNPQQIEIVSNEEANKLRATMDIFFTKDALDEADFKDEKKIYINGYVLSYDSKAKKDAFFPQQFIINAQKIDFTNETHVKRFEFIKNFFNVKNKGVYHLQWNVNIFRGADKVEFTYDDLSPKQKEMVEFGYNKLEDFAPKGGVLGETKEENRLVKPNLQQFDNHNDFREGAVETSYTEDDLVYVTPTSNQKSESNVTTDLPWDNDDKESKPKIEVELDDLFA